MNFADPFAHGAYLTWGGNVAIGTGVLKFDIVEEQGVERTGEVTEHPVEKGAPITDHYRVKARAVKLTAFLSQEPVDPSLYPEGGGALTGVEYSLPAFPDAFGLNAGSVISTITDPTSTIVKAFAPKPPTKFTDYVFAYQSPVDTLAKVEAILDDLMVNATLIDVATRSTYYEQHLIETIAVKRNFGTGTGATIEIALKQVRFVTTQTVAAPPAPKKPKDKPNADKGKQNGTPPPLLSGAAKLTDYLGGPLAKYSPSGGSLQSFALAF